MLVHKNSERQIMTSNQQKGFTLIEIMIAMVIIGILASVALASYGDYTMRARRTEAREALMAMAANQEKYYLINNVYTADVADVGGATTDHGYYLLAITASGATYTLTATAFGVQVKDAKCNGATPATTMSLNSTGLKLPVDCW